MTWFQVDGEVTVGCFTKVYARNAAHALEIASAMRDRVFLTPDRAPGGNIWEDGFFVTEPDGTAMRLRVEPTEAPEEG